jgi:hypothetical protein
MSVRSNAFIHCTWLTLGLRNKPSRITKKMIQAAAGEEEIKEVLKEIQSIFGE